jgi:hypothetical protein
LNKEERFSVEYVRLLQPSYKYMTSFLDVLIGLTLYVMFEYITLVMVVGLDYVIADEKQ